MLKVVMNNGDEYILERKNMTVEEFIEQCYKDDDGKSRGNCYAEISSLEEIVVESEEEEEEDICSIH